MKRYAASLCGVLTLLSSSLPLMAVLAEEHKEKAAHNEPARPPKHEGGGERNEQAQNKQKEEGRQRDSEQQNERKEQASERQSERQNERKEQALERQPERQNERKEQALERQPEQQNGFSQEERARGRQEGREGVPVQQNERGMPGNNPAEINRESRATGAFAPRPQVAPSLQGMRQVSILQASPMPHFANNLNPQQQAAAQSAQQNLQKNLYAVPGNQAPANFQSTQAAQTSSYLNNTPVTVGGQPISINSGNTYVNAVPKSSWPSWYQPSTNPGWGFGTGFTLGSIASNLKWLHWGWPPYYGQRPAGFMYPPGYVPTPWVYQPWSNQWMQPGQMSYFNEGPPPQYTMPITVEAVEPQQVTMMNAAGFPQTEIINQLVMYNAYYYPNFGRWGYINRNGYFIWVNPQSQEMIAPL